MKLSNYPETDSLSIDLNARPSVDSQEVADGLVVDVDADGKVVGIDIDHASEHLDLTTLEAEALLATRLKLAWRESAFAVVTDWPPTGTIRGSESCSSLSSRSLRSSPGPRVSHRG